MEGGAAMPRRFSSFLIRWWSNGDTERLELEHIQTGHKQRAASIEDAVAWLNAQQDADVEAGRREHGEPSDDGPVFGEGADRSLM
jgi:hypothetical protein